MEIQSVQNPLSEAQARSAAYAISAWALRYPDEDFASFLCEDDVWSQCRSPFALGGLAEPSEKARSRAAARDIKELRSTYERLFGHVVRGTCPPYELEYGRSEIIQRAAELADVSGFYSAFGLETNCNASERPDHAAVECEFMSVMAAKEAYALQSSDAEGCETIRGAQKTFLEDHLGRWLPALAKRIADEDPDGFYGAVGHFIGALIAADCQRLDVLSGPELLELQPVEPSLDAAFGCGVDESCTPGGADSLVQVGIDPTLERGE